MSQTHLTRNEKERLDHSLRDAHFARDMEKIKDIISKCPDKSYALHNSVWWASFVGKMEYMNEAFSSNKINVSWMNDQQAGASFLQTCGLNGRTDICRFLISKGANISEVDRDGDTPLHQAAYSGRGDVIKVLIVCGANLYIKNNYGDTPIDRAKSENKQNCVDILQTAMSRQQEHMKVKPSENISSEVQVDSVDKSEKPNETTGVYINKERTVGDVWNSQNIPKSKQKSGGFMSYLFGDPDQKLQVENQILSRQLEESKQEIILTRRRADRDIQQAYSRIEEAERTLQEFIESHQQEIQQSNTRLQETRSQLQETQSQLQESDTTLQETQSQLQESDTKLQETQSQLQESDTRLQQANTGVQEMQHQIQELNQHVEEINQQYQQLQETTQRKEDIIRRQQEENQRLRIQIENPHWVIERDEVQMTQEILGTGGWGEVKVGIFRGTKVAVKSLHQMILSQYNLDLFSREMNIASRVRHPNLLQFIGATRVGNPMVLTELMPTSLRKKLEETPLTRSQILTVSSGVASALNYLHLWKPQAILHRDVSSANVLLEPSGNGRWKGKLSDYGSANLLHKTHTVAPGSIAYAAPEAQNPHLHSAAMDVFSFGILIVEMVTRRFPSGVLLEREEQIQSVQWPSLKRLAERCTINNPQLRPTIEQVLQDINIM